MVSISYFIFQLSQTVANGFNLLQARDSARFDPRACCKLLQAVSIGCRTRTRVTCHPFSRCEASSFP
jgi:hypothetical protein